MKICTKCRDLKSDYEFRTDRTKKDGLYSSCRVCCRKYQNNYRKQNLEQERERCRRHYKSLRGYLMHVYHCMEMRCKNKKVHNYHRYGGRGIKIKFKSRKEFVNYVIDNLQVDPRGLQIDRIDNDGHYEPGNIRFVTALENVHNRSNSKCKRN